MEFNCFTLVLTLLVISTIHRRPVVTGDKLKEGRPRPSYALPLCGDAFVKAWIQVCKIKSRMRNSGRGRGKRSIEDFKKSSSIKSITKETLLDSNEANSFLHPLHRYRRQASAYDDPSEECCIETCTYAEIAEYKC